MTAHLAIFMREGEGEGGGMEGCPGQRQTMQRKRLKKKIGSWRDPCIIIINPAMFTVWSCPPPAGCAATTVINTVGLCPQEYPSWY